MAAVGVLIWGLGGLLGCLAALTWLIPSFLRRDEWINLEKTWA